MSYIPPQIYPVTTDGVTVFGDGVNTPLFAKANSNNKILSGGASWSGTGYVYDVSALTYFFDGIQYGPTTPTQITLDAADPTNDRFDAIVVDQAGTISKITGTASANPVFPAIPDTQLLVQYVNVMAGTTQPTILQDVIYNENIEWTASQYDTTTGATGTVNVASTSSPKTGTNCVQATSTNYRRGAKFVRATAIDLQQFAYVQIWFRNDGVGMPTTKNPYFQFQNSAGNPTGNNVNLLTYGVSRTIVSTWQLAVIPVSAFGAITLVKGARMIVTGGTLASTDSWSVDFILLSGGIVPQGDIGPIFQSPSGTLYSNGAATGATGTVNSQFFGTLAGFQAIKADHSIFYGNKAGYNDLVDNTGSADDFSILIGDNTSTGGFKNSIAIGGHATNTAENQFLVGSFTRPIGEVLLGDHAGNSAFQYFQISNTAGQLGTTIWGAFATPTMDSTGNATHTIPNGKSGLYYDPGSLQATATITLPSAPIEGQEIIIAFGGTITTGTVVTLLTISPNSGQTVIGTLPTTATVDTRLRFKWNSTYSAWYIIG